MFGTQENTLWVESFRPDTLEGYIGNEHIIEKVRIFINNGDVPHLLFYGTAGTGKTTLAKIIAGSVDADVMYINASDENSVDAVRDKIKRYASTVGFRRWKIIILDEADYLTPNAQAILRGVMENYSNYSRFILTCNYSNKIIPAIHSRCQGFHIEKTDQTEFTARVATILVEEHTEFNLDVLDTYVKATYPDLRKCINFVQQNVVDNVLYLPNSIDKFADDYKIKMVELFKNGLIKDARKLLCQHAKPEEMEDIYKWMYRNIDLFGDTEEKKDSAILIIKDGLVDHAICADSELNLSATLIKLSRL
jgi:DNA polymerase III delta prime subunit